MKLGSQGSRRAHPRWMIAASVAALVVARVAVRLERLGQASVSRNCPDTNLWSTLETRVW